MADSTQTTIISVEIDEQAKAKLVKGLQDIQNAQKRVGLESIALGDSAEDAAKNVRELQKAERDLSTVLRAVDKDLADQVAGFSDAEIRARKYAESLSAVQGAGGADLSGDLASSFGGLRGAAGAFGGAGASPAFDIAEAFADLGEFAPRLKVQLTAVGDAMRASTSAAGGVVSGIGGVVGSFTGLGAALGTVLTVAVPLALAVGGVAIAMNQFNTEADKQAKLLQATLDAQAQVTRDIASGLTTEDAQAQLALLESQRAAEQELLVTRQAAYDAAIEQLGLLGGLAQQIAPQEQALADAINENKSNIASYDAQIRLLNNAVNEGELAANDTAQAESELAQTRENEAQAAIQAAEQSAIRVAQLQQQSADLIANRAIADSNAYASEKLEREFANEDEKAELSAHLNDLASIRADGAAKVEAIEKEIANLPALQAEAINEVAAKAGKELDKLNQEYFANQIKATKAFAKESGRIATDTAKAAKRIAEDLLVDLQGAVRNNDVVAFLEIQEQGQKDIKRNAEDASEAEKRRAADFAEQQNEQREAFQKRQQELLTSLKEERAQVLQNFAEKAAALETERQQAIAATNQAIANAQARYAQEQAAEDLAASRNAQRIALRDKQEDAAFQRQLSAINQKLQAELGAANQVSSTFQKLAAALASIKPSGSGQSGGAAGGFSGFAKNNKSGKSGGAAGGFSSGGGTINVNMTVGDVATGQTVVNAVNNAKAQIYKNLHGAITGAS